MALDDLRYSVRMLRRSKLTTSAILLTMMLGVGATTAIYSVVHAVLVRPLPFADPSRLVWVAERNDKLHLPTFTTSGLNYQSWLADPAPVRQLGAIGYTSFNLTGRGEPELLNGATITASVLGTLGIVPVAGRSFLPSEEKVGAPPVAMLGEAFWRRRFDGDPSLVGRAIDLNGQSTTIVGIAPRSLQLIAPGDVLAPLIIDPARERRLSHLYSAIGRLPPGTSLERAQAGMDVVMRHVGAQYPEVRDWGIRLVTFHDWIVPAALSRTLLVLLFAVLSVLLIGAANVANLLLARALTREQEVALRSALGANRWRIARQLLLESVLLAVTGGALGAAAAWATLRWAVSSLPPNLLPITEIGVDPPVLAFAFGLSALTGLLFGAVPAWQAAGASVSGILRAGGRSAIGLGRRSRLRPALVVVEVALATALLIVTSLLVQSAVSLGAVELGFQPERLLTFQVSQPAAADRSDPRPFAFYRDLVPSLAALPGVQGVAISSGVPMGQGNFSATPVRPIGAGAKLAAEDGLTVDWRAVSGDYFRVMGMKLLRGRTFTEADTATGPPVLIVSKQMAETFWGTDDVVGRTVFRLGDAKTLTVVGVVSDVRMTTLDTMAPSMYYSSAARLWPLMDVVVRTPGKPESIVSAVRERVHELDPNLPITNVHPMSYWVAASGAQPRLDAALLSTLAGLALLIAALGVYGVLAHGVAQRKSEIGVRMTLGASRAMVVRTLLREGMTLGVAGIVLGLALELAGSRAFTAQLYGITPRDPATLAAVGLALAAVTALACIVPVRRAIRVDPAVSLRDG